LPHFSYLEFGTYNYETNSVLELIKSSFV